MADCAVLVSMAVCVVGAGVVGLVGSPCDGSAAWCGGVVAVGVMFENSTVCL